MFNPELKVPPLLLTFFLGLVMWGIAFVTPGIAIPAFVRLACCGLLVSIGIAIIVSGALSFRRAGTTVNPTRPGSSTELVTGGIYRFTRNPMYVGMLLWLIAFGAWLANPWAMIPCVVFVLYMNRFQIGPEERALQTLFGDPYRTYTARVRRWI